MRIFNPLEIQPDLLCLVLRLTIILPGRRCLGLQQNNGSAAPMQLVFWQHHKETYVI